MQSLPNELLAQIASHLADQPPSIIQFNHEPNENLAYSSVVPLKILSQVSWRWRKVVLPILFRYSRIPLDKEPQWVPMDARLIDSMQGQLSKLSNHEFMLYTKLRNKNKSMSGFAFEPEMDEVLIQLCRIQEGDEFLKATPRIVWLPHLAKGFLGYARFLDENKLKRHVKSVVLHTNKEYDLRHVSTAQGQLSRSVLEIWSSLFDVLEPERVVVAAPPKTMAALLNSHVGTIDLWAFEMKMHYIELLQKEQPVEGTEQRIRAADACNTRATTSLALASDDYPLMDRRPWYHIGYNEGSSITAYSTYEFHSKTAPRILELALRHLAMGPESSRNLTSFTFTAVFPLSSGVSAIMRAIQAFPSIKKITFQLAPGPENDLLSNASKRRKAQSSDFWTEWRMWYKILANAEELFDTSVDGEKGEAWSPVEIVSRDCWSKQLAVEVAEVMEHYLPRGKSKWRGDGLGRWVRSDTPEGEIVLEGTLATGS